VVLPKVSVAGGSLHVHVASGGRNRTEGVVRRADALHRETHRTCEDHVHYRGGDTVVGSLREEYVHPRLWLGVTHQVPVVEKRQHLLPLFIRGSGAVYEALEVRNGTTQGAAPGL
jgi:hypothetical protein